jgi:hypothetical protein
VPNDDPTVADDTPLYRRLHPKQLFWDPNRSRIRATSNAFKDDELSVALGDALRTHGLDPMWVLRMDPQHQLACFTAAFARSDGQAVWRDRLVGHERYGDDPTHGIVEGKKPKSLRSRWADECSTMILQPAALPTPLRARHDGCDVEATECRDPQ